METLLRRRRALAPVLLLLLAPVALAGCLDEPSPIYVASSHVPAGWQHETVNDTRDAASGAVEIIVNVYAKEDQTQGEVYLVSISNVPFVDETDELQKQVQAIAEREDVTLTKTGTTSRELANGRDAAITEYDIEKQTLTGTFRGKGWFVELDTPGFVGGGFAYATTEYEGLLGKQTDTTTWDQARDIVLHSDW